MSDVRKNGNAIFLWRRLDEKVLRFFNPAKLYAEWGQFLWWLKYFL